MRPQGRSHSGGRRYDFNPRTPYGVRLKLLLVTTLPLRISIHAPRMGCDTCFFRYCLCRTNFNPRTPYGVRLINSGFPFCPPKISIHAPRMGCDPSPRHTRYRLRDFNPRTPYGVRQKREPAPHKEYGFQSTHPVWGATRVFDNNFVCEYISIHAPRMGCDNKA